MTQEPHISAEFGLSLTRYQTSLYAYILSLVPDRNAAEDILQETNLTLWEKAEQFEAGSDFLAWATTIARYKALHARRDYARDRLQFSPAVTEQLADRMAERIAGVDTRRRALRDCLAKLPTDDQQMLAQRYHAEGSVQRLAAQTGRTASAVSQKLYRLRAILMECVRKTLAQDA